MKYTTEQIDRTIERATKTWEGKPTTNYMTRKLATLIDLRSKMSINTDRELTVNQVNYLNSLMDTFSDENLAKQENWAIEWKSNQDIREKADIISKYYIAQNGWYMDIARRVQDCLSGVRSKDYVPDYHLFHRMISNEYATKVWQSHIAPHRWKAGELVCCRANAKIDGWTYNIRTQGINVNKDPCMVIQSGSRPISNASKYDEKRGGCRWVSINPIGTSYIFNVLEKDLKIYRQPKKKPTKRSKK